RERYERRAPLYAQAADAAAADVDGIVLAAGGIVSELPPLESAEMVADERVLELHEAPVEAPTHTVPPGEAAKSVSVAERLWRQLRLDRAGTLVAFGGGC